MRSSIVLFSLAGLALAFPHSALVSQGNVQFPLDTAETRRHEDAKRAAAVKEAFVHAWSGYKKHALPHDELHPVTNGYGDSRNGWGASAVDALSTAVVMELPEIVDDILKHIAKIDYTYTADPVSLFETTIRYLGGMLSGYDLLTGPLSHLTKDKEGVEALLRQSTKLADTLKFTFDSPTGIPTNWVNITGQVPTTQDGGVNGLATTGTLVLEWTRLSDLTGDKKYAALTQRAEEYLLHPSPPWAEPFPGLLGTRLNISTGEFRDASGGWNGGDDSFYEYLIKMYTYDQSRFGFYRDRWIAAADSTIRYLASHPMGHPELTFLSEFSNHTLHFRSGHLACFDGGNFILGGAVLNASKYVDFGLALTDSCHKTYNSTPSGIGPEGFGWDYEHVPANQLLFFQNNGFFVTNPFYDLRPEVIESYYYAYRATGDPKYQDWAWDAFVAINATTRTPTGFSAISDITRSDGGSKVDNQESFLFAEVMKYSYLIHAPDAEYQVLHKGKNEFVFNTECHPLKVAGRPL